MNVDQDNCIFTWYFLCVHCRFVLRLAEETEGVVVSNDNYRDLWQEKREWRMIIEKRLACENVGECDVYHPQDREEGSVMYNIQKSMRGSGCYILSFLSYYLQ